MKTTPPKSATRGRAAVKKKPAESEVRTYSEHRDPRPSAPIVGIGASAGGLEAFTRLLKSLAPDTGLAFVLVQHLDPQHDSALTQLLARATSMPVQEITQNLRVKPNQVYVIPPNTTLSLSKDRLRLEPRVQTGRAPRSVDAFFESLAKTQRERAIGVILSGTASDGTLGLEAIKAEGGITFAQDASAKYDSMPRSAVAAGCVDFVLPPEDIATELARIATHPYVVGHPTQFLAPSDDAPTEAVTHEDDPSPLPSGGRGTTRRRLSPVRSEAEHRQSKSGADNGFKKILLLLRNHAGVDFSLYKQPTIQRRITRRMVLSKYTKLEDYVECLRGNAKELEALYADALISVTSFFRNPDAFVALTRLVFPRLLQQRGDEPVRVWVLGCSTGQEAYSIAMAFVEAAEKISRTRKLQVFATDLNDALLSKARHGLYAKSLAEELSAERLRRFFVEEDGGYRIIKPLREMVVFARQNLISDPPFSRLDLISCRNVLIYLEPSLQKKAIPTFHYALKPAGFLLLGSSESIGSFTDLFEPADKKHKLYSKKSAPTPKFHLPVIQQHGERPSPNLRPLAVRQTGKGKKEEWRGTEAPGTVEEVRGELDAQREADRVTVNQFAPPGVLINAELQILQFRGPTSAYLEPPRGKASFDVLKMAREGLMLPLRAAINKARKSNSPARRDHVRMQLDGHSRMVNLKVIPLKHVKERCFLILFEDATGAVAPGPEPANRPIQTPRRSGPRDASRRIADLETDLVETRDFLQSMQEQHEAANEELQASNEEVQSANEELQSVNEELETSKEELESANEELTTVNEEMDHRNSELTRLNGDLVNLQASLKLAIVLLGRDLTIRRFSAQAEKQFDLQAADVGRPISHIRHKLRFEEPSPQAASAPADSPNRDMGPPHAGWQVKRPDGLTNTLNSAPDLETFIGDVISTVREREREICDTEGHWYHLRVRPYFTLDNKVDGAVLVLIDITDLKRHEQAITAAREYAEALIETVRQPLLVLDDQLRIESANRCFYQAFQVTPAQTVGRSLYDLGNGQWDIDRLRTLLEDILPLNSTMDDFLVEQTFEQLGLRSMLLNARRMDHPDGATARILVAIEDITERKQDEAALRESEERFRTLFDLGPVAIYSCDTSGIIQNFNRRAAELWGREPAQGDTDERFCGSFKMFRPDGTFMPHEQCPMADVLTGALPHVHDGEVHIERPDGSRVVVIVTIHPLKNEHGAITGAINCFYDITQRKRAEEALRTSEERFRSLVSVITDVPWVTDAVGAFISPQAEWEAYTGQTWDNHRGFGWTNALHPEDRERVTGSWLRACETGVSYESQGRFWHAATQQWRHFIARAVPLFRTDGSVREWVGTCTDIEQVKRSEVALHRSNEELEARVEDRTRELVTSHEQLRSLAAEVNLAEQRERQRLATELHDYLAQLLVVCNMKLAQAQRQSTTPPIAQALTDIQGVLDQAMTYTRTLVAQLSPPVLNQFGLPTALTWLAEQMRLRDLNVSLELGSEILPLPEDQSVLLFQSTRELLMNVLKHAGTKEARITLTQTEGTLQITVADQGDGFDLTKTAPPAGGSSVPSFGLFSIRERMLALGGRFELHSRPGEGTQAKLIVPLTSQAAKAESVGLNDESDANMSSRQTPRADEREAFDSRKERPTLRSEPSSPARHVRVVLVDDHEMVRQGLRSILDGYREIAVIGEAANGEEAVELANTLAPDVIIMDVNMPVMDGIETTKRIKAQRPRTVIIGLSLSQSSQIEPLLRQAGASGYVSKEAAVDRLYEAIMVAMKHSPELSGE